MPITAATKIAELLQTYGAWGVVIFLGWMCYRLWSASRNDLEKRHQESKDDAEKRHKEFQQVLQETTKALSATAHAQDRASATLERATEVLEEAHRSNEEVRRSIEYCKIRNQQP